MNDDHKAMVGVESLLHAIGEDPDREGLKDTPRRVLNAMKEMTSGVNIDIAKLLAVSFEAGTYDEIISVGGISFVSLCEHHLLPFSGKAHVAYLPSSDGAGKYRVVGLSKIPRVVDAFARRLQLQERMTMQIAQALDKYLTARGVAVVVEAEHSCMACRGVRKAGAKMGTSAMLGVFRSDAGARAEVMNIINRVS